MAVLGQLSAGLAHELNQPLAALRTLSDNAVVLMDKERLPETRANLERISLLVGRLGELTRRLKSFAHKPGDALVPTPLGTAVANAQALLADRLKRLGVAFEVQMRPEGLCALADPGLVEQVLVNLMVNALDAMAAMEPAATPRRLRVVATLHHGAPDDRVHLQVHDNGPGIAPGMRAHLFEPFATSKPAGAGLGLGLMISQRIVRSFGGELGLCEPAGPGWSDACFRIDLPACTAARPALTA
jgi:two-component system C4-dicarboxylate transport sensor histidine kinase DctB